MKRRYEVNEENQVNYYSIIPATIRYDNRLKASEKLIYDEITALTNRMSLKIDILLIYTKYLLILFRMDFTFRKTRIYSH